MEHVLEQEFLQTAQKRSELLRQNDSKAANKQYDKIHKLKGKLRLLPDRGAASLKRILSITTDPEVKILAAAALLAVDESFARSELERIRDNETGLPSFTADMTLKEWAAGSIREYWA